MFILLPPHAYYFLKLSKLIVAISILSDEYFIFFDFLSLLLIIESNTVTILFNAYF